MFTSLGALINIMFWMPLKLILECPWHNARARDLTNTSQAYSHGLLGKVFMDRNNSYMSSTENENMF